MLDLQFLHGRSLLEKIKADRGLISTRRLHSNHCTFPALRNHGRAEFSFSLLRARPDSSTIDEVSLPTTRAQASLSGTCAQSNMYEPLFSHRTSELHAVCSLV